MRKRNSLIVLLHHLKFLCPFKRKKKEKRKYELINLVTERVRPWRGEVRRGLLPNKVSDAAAK